MNKLNLVIESVVSDSELINCIGELARLRLSLEVSTPMKGNIITAIDDAIDLAIDDLKIIEQVSELLTESCISSGKIIKPSFSEAEPTQVSLAPGRRYKKTLQKMNLLKRRNSSTNYNENGTQPFRIMTSFNNKLDNTTEKRNYETESTFSSMKNTSDAAPELHDHNDLGVVQIEEDIKEDERDFIYPPTRLFNRDGLNNSLNGSQVFRSLEWGENSPSSSDELSCAQGEESHKDHKKRRVHFAEKLYIVEVGNEMQDFLEEQHDSDVLYQRALKRSDYEYGAEKARASQLGMTYSDYMGMMIARDEDPTGGERWGHWVDGVGGEVGGGGQEAREDVVEEEEVGVEEAEGVYSEREQCMELGVEYGSESEYDGQEDMSREAEGGGGYEAVEEET